MKFNTLSGTLILVFAGLLTSGCYTQLQTAQPDEQSVWYTPERVDRDQRPVRPEPSAEIVNEEDYEIGYEDGWVDAEDYYFKDYETAEWYRNSGATLATAYNARVINNYYYGHTFYPSSYYLTRYQYPRWRFGFGFHFGFHSYDYYGYPSPYYTGYYHTPYYAYPSFGGYYGYHGYYGHRPVYYGIVYYNSGSNGRSSRTVRNNPRSTGLSSAGVNSIRNRSVNSAVTRQAADARSTIRSKARTNQVQRSANTRARVNSRSSTVQSRGTSNSVRSRSSSNSGSRSKVGTSSSSTRSSGSVQRNRSSNNRSSGSVGRSSRSNNRSSSVGRSTSRSKSSSVGRSSRSSSNRGTVRSSSGSNNSRSSSSSRSRSSGRD